MTSQLCQLLLFWCMKKPVKNSSSMDSFITNFRSIEWFSYDLEKQFR